MEYEIFTTQNFLETQFGEIPTYSFSMKVKDVLKISYIARRGIDNEEGSVQRILTRSRIQKIQEYVLNGGSFFSSFILNWNNNDYELGAVRKRISIPIIKDSAQVLDGQHRLAGLQEAYNSNPEIGNKEIIVTMCLLLTTKEAAEVFLNINTEQKPVPKTLVYDLFGEVNDDKEHAINRARDIANELNGNPESPLFEMIRFPGSKKRSGTIELSTFVLATKKHLEKEGKIRAVKLKSLERQSSAMKNYFTAIRSAYENSKIWNNKSLNPFLKAAGLGGAIDFFAEILIDKCVERKSFTVETIENILKLGNNPLLTWTDLKGRDGKTQRKIVSDYLGYNLRTNLPEEDDYDFG